VPADRITAMARRAFGAATEIVSAEELASGRYNTPTGSTSATKCP
jgi:hypothetical protein